MRFRIISTFKPYDDQHEELLKLYPVLSEFEYKNGFITINSIDDLIRLRNAIDEELIFMPESHPDDEVIEIYDAYRE